MSLFAKYKKEREGKLVKETDKGFAVYYYPNQDSVYIEDIFVDISARLEGLATKMADEIVVEAKERGCKYMLGSVLAPANGSTNSLKVLLHYGMRLHSVEGQMIYFIKEI